MPYFIVGLLLALLSFSCSKPEEKAPESEKTLSIRGADMSFLPEIRSRGIIAKNIAGQPEDMLVTLKKEGVNAVRIRIWHQPEGGHSGFEEVKAFAGDVRALGMQVWLTVHYSDNWADPGKQVKPSAWNGLSVTALGDSVYSYTQRIMEEIQPDIIQIGNEINSGLLWPEGRNSNLAQMTALLAQGIKAVRDHGDDAKIMLHYAGHENAAAFFAQLPSLDYDLMGLSYYPFWHGKNLVELQSNLNALSQQFGKDIIIAETSYPFTFTWDDNTNNIIGLDNQILPDYPPTIQGQQDFLTRLKEIIAAAPKGVGICYWGTEWVAFKGSTATDGSTWENQALWNFNNQALPALRVLGN